MLWTQAVLAVVGRTRLQCSTGGRLVYQESLFGFVYHEERRGRQEELLCIVVLVS